MAYDRDLSDIRYSIVVEALNMGEAILEAFSVYNYEDTAVTQALVDLKLLPAKNGSVTESEIRAFGLTLPVSYVLDAKYRKNGR